jgi:hypothetical protein
MKEFLKQRYHLHLLAGALIMLAINYTFDFEGVSFFGRLIISQLAIFGVAFSWEWYHGTKGSEFDYKDIYWTLAGGLLMLLVL